MAKETDQTRWVGIRPTDPPENIPVTESAPLASIEVEPVAGSANFPVTESNPLTSIRVQPVLATTEFKTLTEKRAPAIADLQAPETMVRVALTTTAVAGNNLVTVYTVPAGKLFKMQVNSSQANNVAPGSVTMRFDEGANQFVFFSVVYGAAWSLEFTVIELLLNEGEIIKHLWTTCGVGNKLYDKMIGYLIDKY